MFRDRASRRAAAFSLALLLSVAPFAAPPARAAGAATSALAVTLDGAPLAAAAVVRGESAQIALAALARADGWNVDRRARTVRLTGDDRVVELTLGARTVREDGDVRGLLQEPLAERGGTLFVGVADAARLFGLRVARERASVAFAHPPRLGAAPVLDEIAHPPTPRPRPTATPAPTGARATTTIGGGAGDAGRILMSVERTGGLRMLRLSAESHGSFVQTNLDASGIDGFGTPNATVTFGGAERGGVVGLMGDPLSGEIVGGDAFDGAELRRLDRGVEYFAGHRLADGLFESGVTGGDPLTGANTIAFLHGTDGTTTALLRHVRRRHHPWGDFTAEAIASARGAGIGLGARTTGRTFVESRLSLERGLPVGANAQPVALDVGRRLSDVTTLAGGIGSSGSGALVPFVGLSSRLGGVIGSVSLANRALSTSIGAQTAAGSLQLYATGGAAASFGLNGGLALRGASLDLAATSSGGERDASLTLRTTRSAVGIIGGFALYGNRFGPITGLALPLTPLLALEGTVRAAGPGGHSTRLALAMRIPRAQPRKPRTIVATVHVEGERGAAPLRLIVDGLPLRAAASATLRADVTPGAHTFAVESVDGALGSPQVIATLASAGDVQLPLWRERAIAGRVTLADPQAVPADTLLSGIVVTIAPGDASAVTDADGRFFFGRQPFPPDARLAVDPDTLPQALRAPEAVALRDGEMELALPGAVIDAQVFPAARGAAAKPRSRTARAPRHAAHRAG
jgi:hypothetical protein